VDKAKQHTDTIVTAIRDVGIRKVRETRCKSLRPSDGKCIAAPTAFLSKTRRASTGSCGSKSEKKLLREKMSKEKELPRQQRRANQGKLDAQNAKLRWRLKNVRSKLFSETRSFTAYKSARSRQTKKRNVKSGNLTMETDYTDRSFDFSRKRRQGHGARTRSMSLTSQY